MAIINGVGRVGVRVTSGGGAPSYDTDAQAFFTATSLTDATKMSAINTYILDLKSNSLWSKFKEIHFYFLGDSTKNSYNVKNPSTFTNVFSSGWSFDSNGATPNATSAYCQSGFNPSTHCSANSIAFGVYFNTLPVKSSSANGIFIAGYNTLYRASLVGNYTYWNGGEILRSTSIDDNYGFQQVSRYNTTQQLRKHKGNSTETITDNYTSMPNGIFHKGKANGLNLYEDRRFALTYISDGLTSSEMDVNYTIVQKLMTNLGINVGIPIVSDSDAQAFLNSANITDSTQASAINTLVTGLKSAGLWTKMKALYPVVGGNATAHAKNLINPSLYNLSFSSGWTHTSTGMTPNGTSAYADTLKTQSEFMTSGSGHMSFYSRSTGSSGENRYEMGNYGGPGYTSLAVRVGDKFQGHINTTSLPFTTSNTDGRGFYIASRISSTNLIQSKNSTQYTATSAEAFSVGNIVIGGIGTISTPQFYTNKECSLVSIGSGLSSAEMTTYNTLVQSFQTTLGRNV